MLFNIAHYYPDLRKIFYKNFDTSKVPAEDILHDSIINIIESCDYDPTRGGASTYMLLKLRTTYLNYFQRQKIIPPTVSIDEEDKKHDIIAEIKEKDDFTELINKRAPQRIRDYWRLMYSGYNQIQIIDLLKLSFNDGYHCYKEIMRLRKIYEN